MAIKQLPIILLLTVIATNVTAADLRPFTSDGCSAFPDGTISQENLWFACCFAHDKAYWAGGSKQERQEADEKLKACVIRVGEPTIAQLMLAGVRVGGTPYLPTKFRWGYGWPYPRGYKVPTAEEQIEIEERLKEVTDKKPNPETD